MILKRIWGSGRGFPEHPNEETLSESQSSNLVVKCIQCKLSICQGVIFAIFYVYCIIAHLEHFSPMFEKYDLTLWQKSNICPKSRILAGKSSKNRVTKVTFVG